MNFLLKFGERSQPAQFLKEMDSSEDRSCKKRNGPRPELSKTTEQEIDQSREDQYYIMESSVEAAQGTSELALLGTIHRRFYHSAMSKVNASNTLLLRRQLAELTKHPVEGFSAGESLI